MAVKLYSRLNNGYRYPKFHVTNVASSNGFSAETVNCSVGRNWDLCHPPTPASYGPSWGRQSAPERWKLKHQSTWGVSQRTVLQCSISSCDSEPAGLFHVH